LNNLVKHLKGRVVLTNGLGDDVNPDSDCEDDPTGAGDETLRNERGTRAVLVAGSFSAWRSLFFYRCTDEISFALLKSQGADARLNHIRENTVAAAPSPCSPKSIYVLANMLGIQALCDMAFADIKSKVTPDNVVDEVFSWVTATQEKIMEMECELLTSNPNDPRTIALVKQNIGSISDGASSHCAAALRLGLQKAFDQKQKRQPTATLRCSQGGCEWNSTHPPYSSVGSNIYCRICFYHGRNRCLQCVGCGYSRTSSSASCQGCGKMFV